MAIHLLDSNALILEPAKCGTTWIREVLSGLGVRHKQARSVIGVCPRHSHLEHYPGVFSKVYCPIRNPYDWIESFYNFHLPLRTLTYKSNTYYSHGVFGSRMPDTFFEFIEYLQITGCSVSKYFEGFLSCKPIIMRQEMLVSDLFQVLNNEGIDFNLDILTNFPRIDTSTKIQTWSNIPGDLKSRFRKSESIMFKYYQDM